MDKHAIPIPNANILNTSSDFHTHSNPDGEFSLEKYSHTDVLKVSSIGFVTQYISIEELKESNKVILEEDIITLKEVTITPRLNALQIITNIDIQTDPVNSSQDILRRVPGLIIGQHAGGGKAEQIFLRGFDIDHGTDINITADGIPVNMVSHAHGQGYADLHFIIPETVDKIDFGKGPYYQEKGNFTTAGYVEFQTKDNIDDNLFKLELGQFETLRLLGMLDLINHEKQSAYVATEFISSNGYFESPQHFQRINLFGKYSAQMNGSEKLGITLSHFNSSWDASGQIPLRAIESGLITRLGAIDDTEGGQTSRSNILINYDKILNGKSSIKSRIYYSQYDFTLFSNFTFFLEDPISGDQIKQQETRNLYGLQTTYFRAFSLSDFSGSLHAGLDLRNDQSTDNALSRTANRTETLSELQRGDINETNLGLSIGAIVDINKWHFNPSIRFDYFDFQYVDALLPTFQKQGQNKGILSPNFNILYNPSRNLQLYLKSGRGFHSNDTRVVVAESGNQILPAAYGMDLGYIWKPRPNMVMNMAYWYLFLEQEFVYVGDAGIVEPSGKTSRQGLDFSFRHQPVNWLFWNVDATYTHARSIDAIEGENFIPLSPDLTITGGVDVMLIKGLYGSLDVIHLADRPANEDNSIVADGYTVTNINAGYRWNQASIGFQIQNLFNVEWNETQFATESRLQNELDSVEEIHFTPGTPFFMKAVFQYEF